MTLKLYYIKSISPLLIDTNKKIKDKGGDIGNKYNYQELKSRRKEN